jgi:uncharacterized protein GlcG (DUF336 family)
MTTTEQTSATGITLARANAAIDAAITKADELGLALNVAILDAGGHLIASARMDGALLAAVETSHVKARTSILFGQATKDLVAAVQPGAPLYAIEASTRDPLAFIPGGIPVTGADGRVIGGVGVGGASPDEDHEVAGVALAAL